MTDKKFYFADELLAKLGKENSLQLMYEAQDVSREVGFDFTDIDIVLGKVEEETEELKEAYAQRETNWSAFEDEIGDCFFSLINLCRHAEVDFEEVLQRNCFKYLLRCKWIEEQIKEQARDWKDLSLDEIYALWKQAKKPTEEAMQVCN